MTRAGYTGRNRAHVDAAGHIGVCFLSCFVALRWLSMKLPVRHGHALESARWNLYLPLALCSSTENGAPQAAGFRDLNDSGIGHDTRPSLS